MSLKNIIAIICATLSISVNAKIPVDVMLSCRDGKAYAPEILMTQMKHAKFSGVLDADPSCEIQQQFDYENKVYGSAICDGKDYLIVKNIKLNLGQVANESNHPLNGPSDSGRYIHKFTEFWKIAIYKNDYLCLISPLSLTGKGANHSQYYIVENAFNGLEAKGYFYYFDEPFTGDE